VSEARPPSGDLDEVLATVRPSPGRRAAGVGMLAALGLILLWVAATSPAAAPGWQAFLIGTGAASLWAALAQWRATARGLVLTRAGLFDTEGTEIVALERIESADRGLFAFKPSGGFLLRLSRPAPRGWAPGLWWRLGRRVGVGGATPGGETRAMADLLTILLAERDGAAPASRQD
jgi:hypothetical protein